MVGLGHQVAASTVWNVLKVAGTDPAPQRSGPTWRQLLAAQAHAILAVDVAHGDTVGVGPAGQLQVVAPVSTRMRAAGA